MAGRSDKNKLWLPATVSLRGLRIGESEDVPEEFRGMLIPWSDVDPDEVVWTRNGFKWIGEDGLPIIYEDRFVWLTTENGPAVFDIACRAHCRYFQRPYSQMWFRRKFLCTDDERRHDRIQLWLSAATLGAFYGLPWFGIMFLLVRLLGTFATYPYPALLLLKITIGLLLAIPALIALYIFQPRQRRFETWLRVLEFTPDRYTLEAADGRVFTRSSPFPSLAAARRLAFERRVWVLPIYKRAKSNSSLRCAKRPRRKRPWRGDQFGIVMVFVWVFLPLFGLAISLEGTNSASIKQTVQQIQTGPLVAGAILATVVPTLITVLCVRSRRHWRNAYSELHERDRTPA